MYVGRESSCRPRAGVRQNIWRVNVNEVLDVVTRANVGGRLASTISGLAIVATCGTRSIPGVSAHHAFVSGLSRNALSVAVGRRIRIGMGSDSASSRAR